MQIIFFNFLKFSGGRVYATAKVGCLLGMVGVYIGKILCKPDIFEATYEPVSQDHKQRHIFLHKCFDELLADMIRHTKMLPSTTTLSEFMKWSYQQTLSPTEVKKDA